MKDDLVERVARDITSTWGSDPDELVQDKLLDPTQQVPRWWLMADAARSALSAIRPGDELPCGIVMPMEATGEINGAFHTAIEKWLREECNDDDVYRAMIEAVKKDAAP